MNRDHLRRVEMLTGLLGGNWRNVTAPVGFGWSPPFNIQTTGSSFQIDPAFDLQTYANVTVAKTVYVDRSMPDDTGDGLTWLTAKQKVSSALGISAVDRVYIAEGVYEIGYGWETTSPSRNVEVIGVGTVRLSAHNPSLSWSAASSHYSATAATKIWNVFDASILDSNGDYSMLDLVASEAAVDAAANTWYWDGATLYVHTSDERAPDSAILPMQTSSYTGVMTAAKTIYLNNLQFEGGSVCFGLVSTSSDAKLYAEDCSFKYCYNQNACYGIGGGEIILVNCTAARNIGVATSVTDGFKMSENTGQYANLALIGCTGRHNGKTGDTSSNGYSRHSRGNTIIVNGEYYANFGRNIHDVDVGTGDPAVWCLGVNAHDSAASGATDVNFAIGASSAGGTMWLDGCQSSGSANDLEADTNATLYYRNMTPAATTGGGTIATY